MLKGQSQAETCALCEHVLLSITARVSTATARDRLTSAGKAVDSGSSICMQAVDIGDEGRMRQLHPLRRTRPRTNV